jgi:hypothetical protein
LPAEAIINIVQDQTTKPQGDSMENEISTYSGSAYEIRLKGHLDPCWTAYFEGWSINNLDNGEVLLRGSNIDQAGLHGILNKIRDLNLTLLSVCMRKKEDEQV